jgi:hypothetical protein
MTDDMQLAVDGFESKPDEPDLHAYEACTLYFGRHDIGRWAKSPEDIAEQLLQEIGLLQPPGGTFVFVRDRYEQDGQHFYIVDVTQRRVQQIDKWLVGNPIGEARIY